MDTKKPEEIIAAVRLAAELLEATRALTDAEAKDREDVIRRTLPEDPPD